MPVYVFRCPDCGQVNEHLLPLGETAERPCPACGGTQRLKLSRVAVKYDAWGFTKTDSLVADTRGKDFKTLSEKATEIADT